MKQKYKQLIEQSKVTFWVLTNEYENYLNQIVESTTNHSFKQISLENVKFLLNMKQRDRIGLPVNKIQDYKGKKS